MKQASRGLPTIAELSGPGSGMASMATAIPIKNVIWRRHIILAADELTRMPFPTVAIDGKVTDTKTKQHWLNLCYDCICGSFVVIFEQLELCSSSV